MLPKPLYSKARTAALKIVADVKGETNGKTGLASVPIEIGRSIRDTLKHLARENHVRISDGDCDDFLAYLGKQNVIVAHPWGGWMAPQVEDAPPIPPVGQAEDLVKKAIGGVS